jgi:hypothetical protein
MGRAFFLIFFVGFVRDNHLLCSLLNIFQTKGVESYEKENGEIILSDE